MSDKIKSRADLRGKPLGMACYIAEPVIFQKEKKILCQGLFIGGEALQECRACGAYVENGR